MAGNVDLVIIHAAHTALAHTGSAAPGGLTFALRSSRTGCEGRVLGFEVILTAGGAPHFGFFTPAEQLFELRSTIVARVFVDGHKLVNRDFLLSLSELGYGSVQAVLLAVVRGLTYRYAAQILSHEPFSAHCDRWADPRRSESDGLEPV